MIWWKNIKIIKDEVDIERLNNFIALWNVNIKIDNEIINSKNITGITTEDIRISLPVSRDTGWYYDYDFDEEVLNRLN
jgi:hypothetical protein